MHIRKSILLMVLAASAHGVNAQEKKFSITGTAGVTYELYDLTRRPPGNSFFMPRRPRHQARILFSPTMQFGKDFKIPFNINFATKPTNFAGPYAGIQNQSFAQWIVNPLNNFGISPSYKWAEVLLGTQYVKYSDLSTGDLGIFGYGFNLKPKIYRLRFFNGLSQQEINHVPGTIPPGVQGAYKRKHWMFQTGIEKDGNYKVLLNFVKAHDRIGTLMSLPPPTIKRQDGFTMSLVLEKIFKGGWYARTEAAQGYFTKDRSAAQTFDKSLTFDPFIFARASTQKDYAGEAALGKRSAKFDMGYRTKYVGAGYQTMGYPYMQQDHWDNTIDTRINAWKSRMNIVASAGIRTNNISNVSLKSRQFIGNINWFTQFSEHFSLNANYNNFGFTAASGLNPYGIKNVSNDFGITPSFNWTNPKTVHLVSFTYNYSKYNERDVITGNTTANNTHTALLSYIPTFLESDLTTDFSVLYFKNSIPTFSNRLITFSGGMGSPLLKKKMNLKGQLQYTIGKVNAFTPNNNFIVSLNADYKITERLTWNSFLTTNYFKYGDELNPPALLIGANYLENTFRTGMKYTFR